MEKIFETILNLFFLFLGNRIKGYRTIILNATALIVGLWAWVTADGGLFTYLCSLGDYGSFMAQFCDPSAWKIYPIVLSVLAILNLLARRVTDTQVLSAQLKIGKIETSPVLDAIIIGALIFSVIILIATGGLTGLLTALLVLAVPTVLISIGVIALK